MQHKEKSTIFPTPPKRQKSNTMLVCLVAGIAIGVLACTQADTV